MDDDNDGRFPDDTLVEVRYPRNRQKELGDRSAWPWLPGTILSGRRCSHAGESAADGTAITENELPEDRTGPLDDVAHVAVDPCRSRPSAAGIL